jgi:hypothetical protein
MGTSQSSGGPSSGVSMVPPWAANLPTGDLPEGGQPVNTEVPPAGNNEPDGQPVQIPVIQYPASLAPNARFSGARKSLSNFARTGNPNDLQRGLGHYARRGYGSSQGAVRRFGSTVSTARSLYNTLLPATFGPGQQLDAALLAGKSAQEVMDALVEAVRPIDGTQDTEAGRYAIRDALCELLTQYPNADLINLNDAQRIFTIERYVAFDVYRRFELDLGKTIVDKAPSATVALSRLKQVRDYIKETVAASFRKLEGGGHTINAIRVSRVVRDALSDTFQVFEDYTE